MNKIITYYDVLKVSRDAPDCVIKAARKALYQNHHPDKFRDDEKPIAEEIIKNIQQAYLTLIDPVQRAEYDRWIDEQEFSQKPLFDTSANSANSANNNPESNPANNNKESTDGLVLIFLLIIIAIILTIPYLKDKNNENKNISQNTSINTEFIKIKNAKNIRSFDFMNHSYSGIFVETVKLNNGVYNEYYDGRLINISTLKSIEYFDIDGDGIEEAFVCIRVDVAGSYGHGESYSIFSYKNGKVKEIFLTQRRRPDLAIINGKSLIIKVPFWEEGDPMCCASKTETSIYSWRNGSVELFSRIIENRHENER